MTSITKIATAATLIATSIILLTFLNRDTNNENIQSVNDPLECGFTDDFNNFLNNQGYSTYNFTRPEIKCACYGGKPSSDKKIKKTPIIFIHGNSDIGFGRGTADGYLAWQTGFRKLATYLIAQGYDKSQLYTTTWGAGNAAAVQSNYHSRNYTLYVRKFIEAVLSYTKAKEVTIISHSMGVTLSRRAIKGGQAYDHLNGTYYIGDNISSKIHAFIGLAGANYGLQACAQTAAIPTCNKDDGFYPGALPSSGPSKYLNDLNNGGDVESSNIYVIWSKYDDLLGVGCLVWGKVTCRIPHQSTEIIKTTTEWNHFAVRDNTGPDMLNWI